MAASMATNFPAQPGYSFTTQQPYMTYQHGSQADPMAATGGKAHASRLANASATSTPYQKYLPKKAP